MAAYDVIGKRKLSLDQLRKGLNTLGLLLELEKNPSLFESLFSQKQEEITFTSVKDHLVFPEQQDEVVHRMLTMLEKFLKEAPVERLESFMKFCTGSKCILALQNKKIEVEFHDENYIYSSTCSLKLQLPKCFGTYDDFKVALLAVINDCGRAFTTV